MRFVALLFLLAVCCVRPSQARAELWLKPELGTQFGTTDFELNLEQRSATQDVKVRSLLAWPVDFMLAGLALGGSVPAALASDAWLWEARLNTSLGNPRGVMVDSDWISSRSQGVPPTLFARTESDTEGFALLGEGSVGYRFGGLHPHLLLDAVAGGRVEYYALTAMGAKGKYLDQDGNFDNVLISDRVEAAVYNVYHLLPFVGSRLTFRPLESLSFPVMGRVHALLSYSHDDHVLRNKDAHGEAYGLGFSASAGGEYQVAERWSLGASAEAYYLRSLTGILRQEFYADDPGTPDDERGSSVPDSDFDVKSVRLQLMVYARLTF